MANSYYISSILNYSFNPIVTMSNIKKEVAVFSNVDSEIVN